MESITAYTRELQALLNKALDLEAEMQLLVSTIDFTATEWAEMYAGHRHLAETLSHLAFKYGVKYGAE